MPYKQDTQKINQWKRENVDRVLVEMRKSEHLLERIQAAIDAGVAKSRQAYILDAVRAALDRDNIPPVSGEGETE